MIACNSIIVVLGGVEREFLVIPLMLQSKERPNFKSGKIEKLYYYENWRDEEYEANLEKENLPDQLRSENYIINYGQDFGKYYLGVLNVDVDTKKLWGWEGASDNFSEAEAMTLADLLFDDDKK